MSESPEEFIFAAALERPEAERAAFLDHACAGDARLRARVNALLVAHEATSNPLATVQATFQPAEFPGFPPSPEEAPGQTLGRYKLLEKIGEGGCGVVYVAEQTEPVRRRVALKVIKLGMDTKSVVARFEAERQALALMDHPNIAKVLDAGTTELGRPFFVMELVRGIRITDYCDQTHLSTQQRLNLFIKVCQAIQHAHQKGIIHRDIKPSNILVTLNDGEPVPKVIDFGIAKATEGRLTDATVYTQLHQFIGTPAYMSPEQAEMSSLDIDTRSDIYSLGVLLYEILTGRPPFDPRELMAQGLDGMRRTIREVEPARPSTRLATLSGDELTTTAQRRSVESAKLPHLLRGDLDWIVMKCLDKDRSRRYETANGLAADLKRHLDDEPVIARPPSATYRFQKAFSRNKLAFIAGGVVAATLLLGVVATSIQSVRARREARRAIQAESTAQQRLAESEAISKFLTQVFQSPDPAKDGRTITVAETLQNAAKKLETDTTIHPDQRARLQTTLANTFYALGLPSEALALAEKVRNHYLNRSGPEHPDSIAAMIGLVSSYFAAGRPALAVQVAEEGLQLSRKVNGLEHTNTVTLMNDLAVVYQGLGRTQEALQLQETLVPLERKVNGPEHPATLAALNNLAVSYGTLGRNAEATTVLEEVFLLRKRTLGPKHPETINSMGNLAETYRRGGRWEEATQLLEAQHALAVEVLGPQHQTSSTYLSTIGHLYSRAGRRADAERLLQQYLGQVRNEKVIVPAALASLLAQLGIAFGQLGEFDQVINLGQEAIRTSPETLKTTYFVVARALMLRERFAEALPAIRQAEGKVTDNGWLGQLAQWRPLAEASAGPEGIRSAAAQQILKDKLEDLRRNLAAHPQDTDLLKHQAFLHLWRGETNEHQALCRRLLALAAETPEAIPNERAAKAVLIHPNSDPELVRLALNAARQVAAEGNRNSANQQWLYLCGAFAAYREGRFADAVDQANRTLDLSFDNNFARGNAIAFRAMARWQLGQKDAAHDDLAELALRLPRSTTRDYLVPAMLEADLMAMCIAYDEARALIGDPPPATP